MSNTTSTNKPFTINLVTGIGFLLMPIIWLALKYWGNVSDRYLPEPSQVLAAIYDIEPCIWIHFAYTTGRLIFGLITGVLAGIVLGIIIHRSSLLNRLLSPSIQAMRSVPGVAIVPFFLLWFGFSEIGRLLLVVTGIAFNIAIATQQVLNDIPEKHRILFKSFGIPEGSLTIDYSIPRLLESLLPTIRFSLSTAIGVVIVSELLGSQIGLGYLVQTARSTFSMHVIFLATILLGILNAAVDKTVGLLWRKMTFWQRI